VIFLSLSLSLSLSFFLTYTHTSIDDTNRYGANCDIEFRDNMLQMFRESCNGKMSCAFEPDWTQYPRDYQCDREIDLSFTCPDASMRHIKIGSGCSDTGGGT